MLYQCSRDEHHWCLQRCSASIGSAKECALNISGVPQLYFVYQYKEELSNLLRVSPATLVFGLDVVTPTLGAGVCVGSRESLSQSNSEHRGVKPKFILFFFFKPTACLSG